MLILDHRCRHRKPDLDKAPHLPAISSMSAESKLRSIILPIFATVSLAPSIKNSLHDSQGLEPRASSRATSPLYPTRTCLPVAHPSGNGSLLASRCQNLVNMPGVRYQ